MVCDSVRNYISFIRAVKPSDHIGLFYDDVESKRSIAFNYLADGLEKSRGVVYVCGEENPENVRKGLASLGVDVEPNERSGNLLIRNFDEWYIERGIADPYKIMNRWSEVAKTFSEKGLGARVAGEASNFYREKRVKESSQVRDMRLVRQFLSPWRPCVFMT